MHKIDSKLIAGCATSPDTTEGVRCFLHRRSPEFPGTVAKDVPPGSRGREDRVATVVPMTTARPRRRLEPDERRAQILTVARKLFGEGTYSTVSTTDIAEAAGVTRALINHYFGGKRGLYLDVVRQMVTVPDVAIDDLPRTTAEERIALTIDRTLAVIDRNRGIWLAATSHDPVGRDDELDQILFDADEATVDGILAALMVDERDEPDIDQLRAMIRSYGAMLRASTREWLVRGTLTRAELHVFLTDSLLHLARTTFPAVTGRIPPS